MPSNRKFYKTVVTVTILSEDPVNQNIDLGGINHQITDGDWSGEVAMGESQKVTASEVAKLLEEQGSDPSFFGLDSEGNDVD